MLIFQFCTESIDAQSTFMTADMLPHKFHLFFGIPTHELIAGSYCLSNVLSCQ